MTTEATTVEPASSGLLDNVQVNDETKAENTQAAEIDHRAEPDSKLNTAPTQGEDPLERPDYWPENFWKKDSNEPDLEGIAKSWSDLRKQISQGKHKAPADGNYDTKLFGEDAANNPVAQSMVAWAKENGVSQASFDQLVSQLQTHGKELMGDAQIDTKAELTALGPNANAIINGMTDWARGLVNKGVWSSDDFEEFKIMGGTARGLRALMKVRESYEGRVPLEAAPLDGAPSKEELYGMVNDPRYKTDSAYRQKVERMFSQYVK